jgi:hypothetical protein
MRDLLQSLDLVVLIVQAPMAGTGAARSRAISAAELVRTIEAERRAARAGAGRGRFR